MFARLFDAGALTIWTDVDGVLSADPRLVPEAVCLPSMSYAEACELAYFGAKVLHPQTLSPLQSQGIPLRIRNTRRPRSEEHTSELQSLMRISYAVFCLKQKKYTYKYQHQQYTLKH